MRKLVLIAFSILILNIPSYAKVEYPTAYFPPIIEEVKIYPEQPIIGKEVRVSAYIYPPEVSGEEVIEAYLYYSEDSGKTYHKLDLEQLEDDEKIWLCTIPAMEKEGEITFYITAIDTAGNVATELPGKVEFQEKEEGEKKPDWLPKDSSLALICKDENDSEIKVAGEFDILDMYAGIDDEYLYLKLVFDGEVPAKPVSLAEQMIPWYRISILNVDKKDDLDGIWGHNYLYYFPKAPSYLMPSPICAIGMWHAGGIMKREDLKEAEHFVWNKNTLYLRVKREYIRENPKERIKLFLSSDYDHETLDVTSLIYIYFRTHSYEVEGRPTLPGFGE